MYKYTSNSKLTCPCVQHGLWSKLPLLPLIHLRRKYLENPKASDIRWYPSSGHIEWQHFLDCIDCWPFLSSSNGDKNPVPVFHCWPAHLNSRRLPALPSSCFAATWGIRALPPQLMPGRRPIETQCIEQMIGPNALCWLIVFLSVTIFLIWFFMSTVASPKEFKETFSSTMMSDIWLLVNEF